MSVPWNSSAKPRGGGIVRDISFVRQGVCIWVKICWWNLYKTAVKGSFNKLLVHWKYVTELRSDYIIMNNNVNKDVLQMLLDSNSVSLKALMLLEQFPLYWAKQFQLPEGMRRCTVQRVLAICSEEAQSHYAQWSTVFTTVQETMHSQPGCCKSKIKKILAAAAAADFTCGLSSI